MAARVLAGEHYLPTLTQASQMFRVSAWSIRNALRNG
jgi:hypothetical protein